MIGVGEIIHPIWIPISRHPSAFSILIRLPPSLSFSTNHWDFLPFRFYVGAWMSFFLLILVATDASALVALITRFTEEAFATLISVVFIIQAFEKLFEISYEAPITRQPQATQKPWGKR